MLAVSLKNGWLRFAHARVDDKTLVVDSLHEKKLPNQLHPPDLRSHDLVVALGHLFEDVLNSIPDHDKEIFISLDQAWIDCQIFSVDSGLSSDEQEAYLNWLLGRRLGPLWESSSVFFQRVESEEDYRDWITTCVIPENALEAFKIAVERAGSVPVWMEPAMLSVTRAAGSKNGSVVLMKDGRGVKVQFFYGGTLRAFGNAQFRGGVVSTGALTGDGGLASSAIGLINGMKAELKKTPPISVKIIGELPGKWQRFVSSRERYVSMFHPMAFFTLGDRVDLESGDASAFCEIAGLLHRRIM